MDDVRVWWPSCLSLSLSIWLPLSLSLSMSRSLSLARAFSLSFFLSLSRSAWVDNNKLSAGGNGRRARVVAVLPADQRPFQVHPLPFELFPSRSVTDAEYVGITYSVGRRFFFVH